MNKIEVLPLGGLEQIGANCTMIGINDNWIMVDLGIAFHDQLGLEVLTPDISFALKLKSKLKAIFVTHAHEDHIGAIQYFWKKIKCPIYLSEFSATVLKQKLKTNKLTFNESQIISVPPKSPIQISDFKVEFVKLSHSILGACGLFIQTPHGNVFHTGDWKIDEQPLLGDKVDIKRLEEIGKVGVDCLLCDSTNVLVTEDIGSENDVKNTLSNLIFKYPDKRITITCFASNLARIETIFSLANQYHRKVAVIGRSIRAMLQVVKDTSYFTKDFENNVANLITEEQAQSMPSNKVLMICTGSQGEERSALFRLSRGEHRHIKLSSNDVVLFSSKVIPGNELCIREMQNSLVQNEVEIVTAENEHLIHVSGHPNRTHLKKMYEWLKPKSLIPVHGDPVMLHAHKQFAEECGIKNTIIISSGDTVEIGKKLQKVDHIDVIYNALDSKQLIGLNHGILRQRKIMSMCGFVGISFVLNKTEELVGDYELSVYGIYLNQAWFSRINREIEGIVKSSIVKYDKDELIKTDCKEAIKQLIYRFFEKKPIVEVFIHRV